MRQLVRMFCDVCLSVGGECMECVIVQRIFRACAMLLQLSLSLSLLLFTFRSFAVPRRSNPLVEYMLNGTAVKEALAHGKNMQGRDCDALYPGCPLDRTSINGVLSKFMPSATEQ